MKHLRNLVLFVMLASAQFAYSAAACDPCDPCNTATECDLCNVSFCDMEFELYVDALYWHANAGSWYPDESDKAICPDYSWGWRIGGSAYWNSWDFGFRYTSLNTSVDKSIGEGKSITEYKKKVDFQVFDLEVGRACCVCEGILFRPFLGGKFADIENSRDERGSEDYFYKKEFKGAGLYVGFDTRWQICSFDVCDRSIPVALVARASTGIMDGDFKRYDSKEFSESYQKDCQFIPVHEVYTGLEFRMCDLCGVEGFMQLGYEAQYWGWREVDNSEDPAHLGLGGLVLRFGANF